MFFAVKALNEIKASLGWRVVYAWVGDDPCGDGDLPPWSGVTCSTVGDYRVVTELWVFYISKLFIFCENFDFDFRKFWCLSIFVREYRRCNFKCKIVLQWQQVIRYCLWFDLKTKQHDVAGWMVIIGKRIYIVGVSPLISNCYCGVILV